MDCGCQDARLPTTRKKALIWGGSSCGRDDLFTIKKGAPKQLKACPLHSAYGVGVHLQDRHSGGGCDRKRGGEPTRDLAFTPLTTLISFTAACFRLLQSQVYTVYIYIYMHILFAFCSFLVRHCSLLSDVFARSDTLTGIGQENAQDEACQLSIAPFV